MGLFSAVLAGAGAAAAPYLPQFDDEALETLQTSIVGKMAQARALQSALAAEPDNVQKGVDLAEFYIRLGAAEADPRFYAYAEGALARWTRSANPPDSVLMLRANTRQFRHDFAGALDDLARVLAHDPENMQAWLMRAELLRIGARYGEAAESCRRLQAYRDPLAAIACLANIESLSGDSAGAYDILAHAVAAAESAHVAAEAPNPAVQHGWLVLAEMAERREMVTESEGWLRKALAAQPDNPYLLAVYADLLIEANRPGEVEVLLVGRERIQSLLLRLALARQVSARQVSARQVSAREVSAPGEAKALIARLDEGFGAIRLRGETPHLGEEARFLLSLQGKPREAFALARQNWDLIKEARDARILAESALATGDPEMMQDAYILLQRTKLNDLKTNALIAKLAQASLIHD